MQFNSFKYEGVCDVNKNFNVYFKLLTNKVASMFLWKNLPDTIDSRYLEFQLLLRGKICWFMEDNKLYALGGNIGGEPNCYYMPSKFIVANPILGSKELKIRNLDGSRDIESLDGILMANSDVDYECENCNGGLYGLIYQTAGLLADNVSSLNIAQINSRLSTLFTADSEAEARTGELILKEIYSGKPYKILVQDLVEKFGITPIAATNNSEMLMRLIEAKQYILAQFFNEIGIGANYNMKRERLNTAEVEMNNDCLDVNIFSMLKNRKEAIELINQKWGLEIEVELNPAIFNEEEETQSRVEDLEEAVEEDLIEVEEDPVEVEEKEEEKEETLTSPQEDEESISVEIEVKTEDKDEDKDEGDEE